MKKIIIAIILIALIILAGLYYFVNKTEKEVIGGDIDSKGCLIAAGYSFNESEKECVREWSYESDRYQVNNYQSCVDAGYPVMESFPEQCMTPGGRIFRNNSGTTIPADIVNIKNDYGNKIVYSPEQNIDNLRIDCNARGGTFNECGSSCSDDAEVCVMMCALTCEGL
jgi:hypothetical protein